MFLDNLPKGWKWKNLGETTTIIGGGTPSRKNPEFFNGDIVWLTPSEIPKEKISTIFSSREKITKEGLQKSSARMIPKGSVLMTSRASIGYVAISGTDVTTNQGFASFICSSDVEPKYLAYWLKFNKDQFIELATGTTFKEISKSKLQDFPIPLPDILKQKEIVEKIENLFTQLDAGVAGLKRVQAALKRYRASVLKAACEGRLVLQEPIDEPASSIIVQSGKKYLIREQYPKIPANWCWVKLGDLVESFKNGLYKPAEYYSSNGVACLRMYNIEGGEIIWKDIKRMILSQDELETYRLNPGDILVNRVNSRELVGKAAVINDFGEPVVFESKNIRLKINQELANSNYVNYYIEGNRQQYFNFNAQQVVGMASINQHQISQLPIPLPPINEQKRIVEEMEYRKSTISKVEQMISKGIQQASRLRMTILNMAFEGKLD